MQWHPQEKCSVDISIFMFISGESLTYLLILTLRKSLELLGSQLPFGHSNAHLITLKEHGFKEPGNTYTQELLHG